MFMAHKSVSDISEMEFALMEKLSEQVKEVAIKNWQKLRNYLMSEKAKGKTEFRIAFQGDRDILIHPFNKDGETIDIDLFNLPKE